MGGVNPPLIFLKNMNKKNYIITGLISLILIVCYDCTKTLINSQKFKNKYNQIQEIQTNVVMYSPVRSVVDQDNHSEDFDFENELNQFRSEVIAFLEVEVYSLKFPSIENKQAWEKNIEAAEKIQKKRFEYYDQYRDYISRLNVLNDPIKKEDLANQYLYVIENVIDPCLNDIVRKIQDYTRARYENGELN